MSRRDLRRIADAQREGTRQRLISAGILPERVDKPLAAYEALHEAQGRAWDGEVAFQWVLAQPRR